MGQIEEFESQLNKRAGWNFAQWRSIDLHNHTPASFDYEGDPASAISKTADVINKTGTSVVMFTDHACLPKSEFVTALRAKTPALIISGTELNVSVAAFGRAPEKVGKNCYFHLLIGFNPKAERSEEFWLEKIYHDCGEQQIECGGKKLKAITKDIDCLFSALQDSGAIIIPAHLHSGKDAYKSRSIDDIYDDEEFLRFTRDCFTALEVKSAKTAAYFDGHHDETHRLPKSCIISSDSHTPEMLGSRVSYAQMEKLTFEELRAALELPFRVSLSRPQAPEAYIIGAHIEGIFLRDTWVRLSPHANVLIGVKGSGKTSVLECIRFALGVDVPTARQDEVQKHLEAILGSNGRVRVLVKRHDGAKMLVERSLSSPSFQVTLDDETKNTFQNREGFRFPAHILGWHEIEHVAVDSQVRQQYLNKIAGETEIRQLEEEIKGAAAQVRQKHELAISKVQQISSLEERIGRLEEIRKGLRKLTDENLIRLKERYEAGVSDDAAIKLVYDALRDLQPTIKERVDGLASNIRTAAFRNSPDLSDATEAMKKTIQNFISAVGNAGQELVNAASDAVNEAETERSAADKALLRLATEYRDSIAALTPEQQKLLESHLVAAQETRNLQSLTGQCEELRNETRTLFDDLTRLCDFILTKLDARTTLREAKVNALSEALGPSGVRLRVARNTSAWRYERVGQAIGRSWDHYNEVRKRFSITSRFYEFLRDAFGDLRDKSTKSQYVESLGSPDLGPLFAAYEEDDLLIEFDPSAESREGQDDRAFKPIDQLSAGQRCTAVFPILLTLEKAPLLIDQPEDNLDNRHIANKVAGTVLDNKLTRQMVFTSHNANLVVMSDPEKIMSFEASDDVGRIDKEGFLSHSGSEIMRSVLDILDGGERALELRAKKYGHLRKH